MPRFPQTGSYVRRMFQSVGLLGGIIATILGSHAALASNSVSFTILPGNFAVGLTAVDSDPASDGATAVSAVAMTIDNGSSERAGWAVVLALSTPPCDHQCPGRLAAPELTITHLSEPVALAGDAIDPAAGPFAVSSAVAADLTTPRTVVAAAPGAGNGTYAMEIGLALALPAESAPESYPATLAITIAAAP